MATALARVFQDPPRSLETLILSPKNLVGMWEDYAHRYRLIAKVVSVTQAQNILPDLRRYRLFTGSFMGMAYTVCRTGDTGEDGAEVPPGEVGELWLRGPHVCAGYWNKPEATAELFTSDGFLRTGDQGVRRGDGNICYVGRIKEMYKSGGYNIYPREVVVIIGPSGSGKSTTAEILTSLMLERGKQITG